MQNWNIVISVREGGYSAAHDLLRDFAEVGSTHYFNVLDLQKRVHGSHCMRPSSSGCQILGADY
jgi:hypothetical protein